MGSAAAAPTTPPALAKLVERGVPVTGTERELEETGRRRS